MKKLLLIVQSLFFVTMLAFCFSACSDDEPEIEPAEKIFFEIEKQGYSISCEAQTIDVKIHTNIRVTVNIYGNDIGWISVVNLEQDGEYLTYHLGVKENTGNEERIGAVAFMPAADVVIPDDAYMGGNTVVITQSGVIP